MSEEKIPEVGYAMSEQAYDHLELLHSQLLTLCVLVTPYSHDDPPDLNLPRAAAAVCLVELSQLATQLKDSLHWYSLIKPKAA